MLDTIILDIDNPTMRRDSDTNFVLAHDSLVEHHISRYFAEEINSGRMPVKEAWENHWSYVEDKTLFTLDDFSDEDYRALMPEWEPYLMMAVGMLETQKKGNYFVLSECHRE